MTALKNPYLSNDSQNFLLRKNYNVIKSPSKQPLYTDNSSNFAKTNNHKININNQQSATSLKIASSTSTIKNPFSSKALGERNLNFSYYNTNLPSFYTQPYLPPGQNKQLPFPSYNRPQTNKNISFSANKVSNILSLSRRNLALLNVGTNEGNTSSLQKNLSGGYRPNFISPRHNNEWNSERWRKQLQKQERKNLQKYGSQALRYEITINNSRLNNEYYSTSNKQFLCDKNKYKTNLQTSKQVSKQKNILFDENDQQLSTNHNNYKHHGVLNTIYQSSSSNSLNIPRDPDTYHHIKQHNYNVNVKKFSDIREESQIQNLQSKIQKFCNDKSKYRREQSYHINNNNSESMIQDYKSFVKDDDDLEANNFMSKYNQRQSYRRNKKGPLDMDVFDSGVQNNGLMNESIVEKQNKHQGQQKGQFEMIKNRNKDTERRVRFKEDGSQLYKYSNMESKLSNKYKRYNDNESLVRSKLQSNVQKDYSQKLQFRNKFYYRIKLGEIG